MKNMFERGKRYGMTNYGYFCADFLPEHAAATDLTLLTWDKRKIPMWPKWVTGSNPGRGC